MIFTRRSMNFTPIARKILAFAVMNANKAVCDPKASQESVLGWLLTNGKRTSWGQEHGLDKVKSYADFRRTIPVQSYEAFRPYAMRMIYGEEDVLWRGKCTHFAQSSGTSGGKSKYIPITSDSLHRCHMPGAAASVATYLHNYPDSRMFSGKGFILGGSFANELPADIKAQVGDLSATLIANVNPIVNQFRIPSKHIALLDNWAEKLPRLVDASIGENITNISGVPSWFLTVLKNVIKKAGATTIHDVWPNLEVFFHGGISFDPYRDEYAKITSPKMRYWETYNASEGFFATQSAIGESSMLLLPHIGTFFEFIPLNQVGEPYPDALPLWEVEEGKTYAFVISSCNGLWRYAIGDTMKIESINPVKITIAGRTSSFINAFGEEVMVHNTDAAISHACRQTGSSIVDYTVAPVYTQDSRKGRHQWLIEWSNPPASIEEFADKLDKALQSENSDYQAKRQGDIFLDRLEILSAPRGLFDTWLALTGKLGGQRKVPRLSNDRTTMDKLLTMIPNDK